MNTTPMSGWKDRARKAAEKRASHDDRADIRAERARLVAETEARGRAESEARAEHERCSKLYCPACDGEGVVTAAMAEAIFRAFDRLPSESKADPAVVQALAALSAGVVAPGTARMPFVKAGLTQPRRVAETAAAPAQNSGKSSNRNKLSGNDLADDGALIEV